MPTWPVSLPQSPLLQGFSGSGPNNVIRTEMEAGEAKQRRRTTAGARKITMVFEMTLTQFVTFETFVANDLAGGALRFDFYHPLYKVTRSFRPVGGEPYTWSMAPDDNKAVVVQWPLEVLA